MRKMGGDERVRERQEEREKVSSAPTSLPTCQACPALSRPAPACQTQATFSLSFSSPASALPTRVERGPGRRGLEALRLFAFAWWRGSNQSRGLDGEAWGWAVAAGEIQTCPPQPMMIAAGPAVTN